MIKCIHSLTVLIIVAFVLMIKCIHGFENDINKTTVELIESRGFRSQTHYVTTTDGYILTIFRIVNPYVRRTNNTAVLLQHGFTANSNTFLISRSKNGFLNKSSGVYSEDNGSIVTNCATFSTAGRTLGFVLSACGFDVWLLNSRGNSYSKNHTKLDPNNSEFWEFTIDELSVIDIPAVINYILNMTKKEQLSYIGYSLGTANMFALLSAQPHYSRIIKPFIALAPVVFVSNIKNSFIASRWIKFLLSTIFGNFPMPLLRCSALKKFFVTLNGGNDLQQLNNYFSKETIDSLIEYLLDESSTRVMSHLLQLACNNNFAKFDYGIRKNLFLYGSWKAPDYPLFNISSTHIALIRGVNDSLADNEDISKLKSSLKVPLLEDYVIPANSWTHVDFAFNEMVGKYINVKILQILSKYN